MLLTVYRPFGSVGRLLGRGSMRPGMTTPNPSVLPCMIAGGGGKIVRHPGHPYAPEAVWLVRSLNTPRTLLPRGSSPSPRTPAALQPYGATPDVETLS